MSYTILTGIWEEVDDEIRRQREKHGVKCFEQRPTHDAIAPLAEELGEVAQAETDYFDGRTPDPSRIRHELIQLAASAIAMIRRLDYQQHLDQAYADLQADGGLPEAQGGSEKL